MNIVKIADLKEQFLDAAFTEAQQNLIDKLLKENEFLKEKLKSLESVTKTFGSVSPEEIICIEQIAKLKDRSYNRELTLEEVKRLDLLIKNLRLIKEQSTENVSQVKYRDISEATLVELATTE